MTTKNDSSNPATPNQASTSDTIRDAIGPHLTQIAQASRLIQRDAETCIAMPASATELAAELEETRERCAIAYSLIEQVLDRIDEAHDTGAFTAGPLERVMLAMRAGGAA